MAGFAASTPDQAAIKKAEVQIAKLQRRVLRAGAAAEPFHSVRQQGAVNKLTKALRAIVEQVGSRGIDDVLPETQDACEDLPIKGIQFREYNDTYVWCLGFVSQSESKIKNQQPETQAGPASGHLALSVHSPCLRPPSSTLIGVRR